MCAQTTRLSDRQLKAVKPKDKDYVLTDGDGPTKYEARQNPPSAGFVASGVW
jgi:hypothetical protein